MKKRLLSISVISALLVLVCGSAIIADLIPARDEASVQRIADFRAQHPVEYYLEPIVQVIAVVCGVFMFFGRNWARWLFVGWIGFHVVIGFLNGLMMGLVHVLLSSVILYFLFQARAAAYFKSEKNSLSE